MGAATIDVLWDGGAIQFLPAWMVEAVDPIIADKSTALRESLSDVSHDIWSSWMRWMFTVGTFNEDGTWTMPTGLVERWRRQMETPYTELSEREKDSDREQADKILAVVTL